MAVTLEKFIRDVLKLLEWMPTCSEGSSGQLRREAVEAGIAQLAVQGFCKSQVGGSNPPPGYTCRHMKRVMTIEGWKCDKCRISLSDPESNYCYCNDPKCTYLHDYVGMSAFNPHIYKCSREQPYGWRCTRTAHTGPCAVVQGAI